MKIEYFKVKGRLEATGNVEAHEGGAKYNLLRFVASDGKDHLVYTVSVPNGLDSHFNLGTEGTWYFVSNNEDNILFALNNGQRLIFDYNDLNESYIKPADERAYQAYGLLVATSLLAVILVWPMVFFPALGFIRLWRARSGFKNTFGRTRMEKYLSAQEGVVNIPDFSAMPPPAS